MKEAGGGREGGVKGREEEKCEIEGGERTCDERVAQKHMEEEGESATGRKKARARMLTLGDVGGALGGDERVGVGGVAHDEDLDRLAGDGVQELALHASISRVQDAGRRVSGLDGDGVEGLALQPLRFSSLVNSYFNVIINGL